MNIWRDFIKPGSIWADDVPPRERWGMFGLMGLFVILLLILEYAH